MSALVYLKHYFQNESKKNVGGIIKGIAYWMTTIGTQSSSNNVVHIIVKHSDVSISQRFLFKIINGNIQEKILISLPYYRVVRILHQEAN